MKTNRKNRNRTYELKIVLGVIMAFFIFLSSCNDDEPTDPDPQDIVDVAIANGYNVLAAALTEADLVDDLRAAGPFTVFAPTDAAFAELGINATNVSTIANLNEILLSHVVRGSITSEELTSGEVNTLNAANPITIDADALTVDGINIISPFDVEASNGIIHTIDGVIIPEAPNPGLVEAATTEGLSALLLALETADVTNEVLGASDITIFAPTNTAFFTTLAGLGVENLEQGVIKLGGPEVLAEILRFHIVPTVAFAADLSEGDQTVTTLAGEELTINKTGEAVTVTDVLGNTFMVTKADVAISTGVIHIIDGVLFPTIETPNLAQAANAAGLTTLLDAVEAAELGEDLLAAEAITVFAPTNEAFGDLLDDFGVDNLTDLVTELGGIDNLEKVLGFHVVPATAFSFELMEGEQELTTLADETLTVTRTSEGAVTVEDAAGNVYNVTTPDVVIDNGVVHVIDGVLIPTIDLPDVVEAATAAELTTLLAAVDAAQLGETLLNAEAITVFAPTNEAFGKLLERYEVEDLAGLIEVLGAETVSNVLQYHVVPAVAFAHDLADGEQTFETLEGQEITVTKTANGVTVTDYLGFTYNVAVADVAIDNGVVHVIDGVVLPDISDDPNIAEAADENGLTTLLDAVIAAELDDDLIQATAITVFAPTNEAFAALLAAQEVDDLAGLIDKLGADNVAKVLTFHVVPAVAFAEDLQEGTQMFTTLANEMLTVTKNGTSVTVTDAAGTTYSVTTADVPIENGVVHVIDGVLLPTLSE